MEFVVFVVSGKQVIEYSSGGKVVVIRSSSVCANKTVAQIVYNCVFYAFIVFFGTVGQRHIRTKSGLLGPSRIRHHVGDSSEPASVSITGFGVINNATANAGSKRFARNIAEIIIHCFHLAMYVIPNSIVVAALRRFRTIT